MIRTDRQLTNTRKSITAFEEKLAAGRASPAPDGVEPEMHQITVKAQANFVAKLQEQVDEYEALKRGETASIRIACLEDVPQALIKLRIAKGWSQQRLARALGIAQQQVQRWETQDYENVGFDRLVEIADTLNFDLTSAVRSVRVPAVELANPLKPRSPYRHGDGGPHLPPLVGAGSHDLSRLLAILQKANTFNQTAVVEYSVLAGEKHKQLKEALRDDRPEQEIRSHYVALVTYLNAAFRMATRHNVNFLRLSFDGRRGPPPRICVKGNLQVGKADTIVSLFRDEDVAYGSDVPVKGNTGFAEIAKTGTYYLQNDIPAATLRGDYVNPRLLSNRARQDYSSAGPKDVAALSEAWPRYWRDHTKKNDERAFYRSTLIMPLKLWDDQISRPFLSLLEQRGVESRIFGYLCLDHIETGYFDEAIDLNVAKIFADALCAIILLRFNFTLHSRTFEKVRAALRDIGEADGQAAKVVRPEATPEIDLQSAPQLETPQRPELFSVNKDSSLLAFVREGA